MKIQGRTLNSQGPILWNWLVKETNLRRLHTAWFQYMTFWKRQYNKVNKKISAYQGLGWGKGWVGEAQRTFAAAEILWSTVMIDTCHYAVVQFLSRVQFFMTPQTAACQTSLSFTISPSFLILMCIELMMPPNYLILCHPLLLLPSIVPRIKLFSNELDFLIRWPNYCSFSISLSSEYSRLISFNWLV